MSETLLETLRALGVHFREQLFEGKQRQKHWQMQNGSMCVQDLFFQPRRETRIEG